MPTPLETFLTDNGQANMAHAPSTTTIAIGSDNAGASPLRNFVANEYNHGRYPATLARWLVWHGVPWTAARNMRWISEVVADAAVTRAQIRHTKIRNALRTASNMGTIAVTMAAFDAAFAAEQGNQNASYKEVRALIAGGFTTFNPHTVELSR